MMTKKGRPRKSPDTESKIRITSRQLDVLKALARGLTLERTPKKAPGWALSNHDHVDPMVVYALRSKGLITDGDNAKLTAEGRKLTESD